MKPVSVKYLRLLGETSVLVFLSDNSVMEYDSRAKLWRQTLLKDSVMEQLKSQGSVSDAAMDGRKQKVAPLKDLSSVIQMLEN